LKKDFIFKPPARQPVGSVLYQEHIKRAASCPMAEFAGYIMPLWFSSISQEHRAVREAAGLFDCTHMGILQVSGPQAAEFLEAVCTNWVADMEVGQARYTFLLEPTGTVMDDLIIYRRGEQDFMLVVNAVNEAKVKAYLDGLIQDIWIIDTADPERGLGLSPKIRDLRDPATGPDGMVDIAIQGPRSLEILEALVDSNSLFLAQLGPFRFIDCSIQRIPCVVARTGYTGARIGFELFVQPAKASALWNILSERGQQVGLLPCGLGARDSLRIEAGLPLYGRELAGPYGINPFEAGYGWAVKTQKPFFIGKTAIAEAASNRQMQVARVRFPGGKGIRPIRFGDAVLDSAGRCIGWISSCASTGSEQIGLAYMDSLHCTEGKVIGIYYLAHSQAQGRQGRPQTVEKGQQLQADLQGVVLPRFARF
jgi:glycine hydroxymethyltransferase